MASAATVRSSSSRPGSSSSSRGGVAARGGQSLTVPTGQAQPAGALDGRRTDKNGNAEEEAPPQSGRRKFAEEEMAVNQTPSDGMHIFGIGKAGISRAVVMFGKPPEEEPLKLCFHFPNTFLSHRYVLHCIKEVLRSPPTPVELPNGVRPVRTLRFIDRNVMHGCTGLENRWIVHCTCDEVRDYLLKMGLSLCNKRVLLRRYDDVVGEEYAEYTKYTTHRTKLYGNFHAQLKRQGAGATTGPLPALQDSKTPPVAGETQAAEAGGSGGGGGGDPGKGSPQDGKTTRATGSGGLRR